MKRILFILMGFMFSFFVLAQREEIKKTVGPNDSLNVTVKFEKVKLSKEESAAQATFSALLSNSLTTTGGLSRSVDRLATAVENNMRLSRITKTELVAQQIGITPEKVKQSFRRNSTYKLISLIPVLIIVFWAMWQFVVVKGLDIKKALAGTAIVALYGVIGSIVLYLVLSLSLNNQYFVIKDLMRSMF